MPSTQENDGQMAIPHDLHAGFKWLQCHLPPLPSPTHPVPYLLYFSFPWVGS